jgi:hypothetical protein
LGLKLYKRDDFNFPIVDFPFLCSNILAVLAYGVYISQLIRYSIGCGSYHDFLDGVLLLKRNFQSQVFLLVELELSLQNISVAIKISVSQIARDMFFCLPYHNLWNTVSTVIYILHMQVLPECCYIEKESPQWGN